ncbi:MAG TPA: PaaI family thioesterase [Pyrinomonadaceae bacterium]
MNETAAAAGDADELSAEELARLREAFSRVAYARLLGIKIVRLGRGASVLSLEIRPELTRMEGIVHGGAIASLLDSASAFAVLSVLRPEEQTVTVDLTLHFLRAVRDGSVEARARVLRAGRRVVTVSIEASDSAGKLVATALTTYLRSP